MVADATALGSWMVEGAGSEQQRLEGAVQTLARSRDIMAQVHELLPGCFPEVVKTTEGLVQQISGSVSMALTALTSHGGRETLSEYHRKGRRLKGGSPDRSGVRRVSAEKSSPSKRSKHVYLAKKIMKWPLIEDGFMWKKYGQKNIKFTKHPRNYFRCSQSSSYRCPAVKLVQQTDDDVSMSTVTYIGRHTCQDPLFVEDNGHHTGVTINFASRSLVTSTSGATPSLLFSHNPPQWWPAQSNSETFQPIISKQKVKISGSFDRLTATTPCTTETAAFSASCHEGDSPASSGSSFTGFGDTFEGLCFSDEEDFLLR